MVDNMNVKGADTGRINADLNTEKTTEVRKEQPKERLDPSKVAQPRAHENVTGGGGSNLKSSGVVGNIQTIGAAMSGGLPSDFKKNLGKIGGDVEFGGDTGKVVSSLEDARERLNTIMNDDSKTKGQKAMELQENLTKEIEKYYKTVQGEAGLFDKIKGWVGQGPDEPKEFLNSILNIAQKTYGQQEVLYNELQQKLQTFYADINLQGQLRIESLGNVEKLQADIDALNAQIEQIEAALAKTPEGSQLQAEYQAVRTEFSQKHKMLRSKHKLELSYANRLETIIARNKEFAVTLEQLVESIADAMVLSNQEINEMIRSADVTGSADDNIRNVHRLIDALKASNKTINAMARNVSDQTQLMGDVLDEARDELEAMDKSTLNVLKAGNELAEAKDEAELQDSLEKFKERKETQGESDKLSRELESFTRNRGVTQASKVDKSTERLHKTLGLNRHAEDNEPQAS